MRCVKPFKNNHGICAQQAGSHTNFMIIFIGSIPSYDQQHAHYIYTTILILDLPRNIRLQNAAI